MNLNYSYVTTTTANTPHPATLPPSSALEDMFSDCPDSWDCDESAEDILVRYIKHLESQVKDLGGCLLPYCHHDDNEPCDHGYLKVPKMHPGFMRELDEMRNL